ncbi:MAG TPA: hypothetical protein VNM69_22795 [Bacillus sp. (in: firmicutes)]|uniref:hypothetical protein n=1 Tax=Bacillus litorisediminis TaxID=2922713 RepID=UPI001FAC3693|nr:hypothetical protein [Bacillus litorisediminis]HWO78696.1 hypothetical protein [Bacillus sp. (in: firmicutes)]
MLDKQLLLEIEAYINNHLSLLKLDDAIELYAPNESIYIDLKETELENFIKTKRKPTFTQVLFQFIDQNEISDSQVYKKAGMDRRHFSKIRSNSNYHPKKNTAIALALALELTQAETDELLSAAGYSLSDSETTDLIIQFCLEKKMYDIDIVNQALEYFSEKPLI